ncbi:hypothetical protein E4U43_000238 [Claviceps pusilla]|uniref:Uncharacterized protein n=1 Tax=Claviceps pusilla TaxID=123648 RepID=A0A9P7N9Y7_9HYPO|nr:hypothetical protein E4U43_000238 [Claviceps pusilla]
MPFVVTDNIQSIRKRRRDDDGVSHHHHHHHRHSNVYRLYEPDKHQEYYLLNPAQELLPSRKLLPLSAKSKRARLSSSSSSSLFPNYEDDTTSIHSLGRDAPYPTSPPPPPQHRRRASQQKLALDGGNLAEKAPPLLRPIAALLAPCYICHRRPTKKSDLDSFAQCEGCGERACFVCVRQCYGWNADDGMSVLSEQEVLSRSFQMDDYAAEEVAHTDGSAHEREEAAHLQQVQQQQQQQQQHNGEHDGSLRHDDDTRHDGQGWAASGHRSVVCSRCCVEKGLEGEVICLGCLSGMPGA